MRLGRFEALPNPALGPDVWEITEEDASDPTGKRKVDQAANRILAETKLLHMNTRATLGSECLAVHEGLSR